MSKQPRPIPSSASQPVWDYLETYCKPNPELLERLRQRREVGIAKYGMELYTHDGRDHVRDLEEEILDAIQYAAAVGVRESVDDPERDGLGWKAADALIRVWNDLQGSKARGTSD